MYVRSDLANLEVLHVFHAVDHFLRLLAERIERAFVVHNLVVLLCSGDSRTGESSSGLPVCGCDRMSTVFVRVIEGRSRVGACSVTAFKLKFGFSTTLCGAKGD